MTCLRLYFHPRSPYSRLGLRLVAREGLPAKVSTSLHVFDGPPGDAPFLNPTDSKPKLRYMLEDAPRMTMRAGLPIAPPLRPEPDYSPSITAFHAAREAGKGLEFALAVSDARWGRSEDIADPECLKSCAERAGLDAHTDLGRAPEGATDADRALIERDQVFGVPFAVLDDGKRTQKFWGHDRFELLAEILA
ncbi:DsbA family protein [Parvularcula lutaonensis]|uniref:DsbA family protein n=1 Tax=Parvularcula lutaonensis TaxID=491923 RepID=A0ABV7MAC1_9PROT|nr:DsbA family protein [Parvularcula lutaonensis]GGY46667.1 hypothetical protein GCM10007148_14730 [Parvularcula lutaonensis]